MLKWLFRAFLARQAFGLLRGGMGGMGRRRSMGGSPYGMRL